MHTHSLQPFHLSACLLIDVAVFDRIYTALFSALEQTHCTLVACDSEWVTAAFHSAFWKSTEVMYLQRWIGCRTTGATWNCCRLGAFCVHHTTMHHVTSFHAKPHTWGSNVFKCNLPPALLSRMTGIFYVLLQKHGGWNRYRNKSQYKKLTMPLLPGLKPAIFRLRVRRSNHLAIPGAVCSKGHSSEPNKEIESERHNKAGLSVKGGGENWDLLEAKYSWRDLSK